MVAVETLPYGVKAFGKEKLIYVLTSRETAAAGEHLAYALQASGRATVVGDERTKGAANVLGKLRRIGVERFGRWWGVGVPELRPVSSVTGGNWEGTGVRSDVVVGDGEDAEDVGRMLVARDLGVDREL
jgi:C-terminal processing protease CtpA/Prc